MSETLSVRKLIAAARKDIREEAARQLRNVERLSHPDVAATLRKFPAALRDKLRVSGLYGTVSITVSISDAENLKDDPQLTAALAPFLGEEWTASTNDYTGSDRPNREFRFRREVKGFDESFAIGVLIDCWVKSDSPTCRVITKGVRQVVTEVRDTEIVCD